MTNVMPVKDGNCEQAIATEWRATLYKINHAFVEQDYAIAKGISNVKKVSAMQVDAIRDQIESYGEALAELPAETWSTSFAWWMGDFWELTVDLFTVETGISDLELTVRVTETEAGYQFEIVSVCVP